MHSKHPSVLLVGLLVVQLCSYTCSRRTPEPSFRNIVFYQWTSSDYGQVFRMTTTDGSPGSYYTRVDGTNAPPDGVSYVRGYSQEYEAVKEGLWPNRRTVRGGYEEILRICSMRQYYTSTRSQTFHALILGSCDELDSLAPSGSTIHEEGRIYVSDEHRSAEGTRHFYGAICRGHNDLIYGTVSTWSSNCGSGHSRVAYFDFYAFGGDVFCPLIDEGYNMDVFYTIQHGVRESSAVITCGAGFRIPGGGSSARVDCDADGQWDSDVETCEPINCGLPPEIEFGEFIGDSYNYLDTVELECNEGYQPTSFYQTLRCEATGHWSNNNLDCEPRSCGMPSTPANGQVVGTHYTYGEQVFFRCVEGYRLQGEDSAICQANGEWSHVPPTCEKIVCPALLQPLHGYRIGDVFDVGFSVVFDCYEGYQLVGPSVLRCEQYEDEGVWDAAPPMCEAFNCGNPPVPENGSVEGEDFQFGSRVTFSCDLGFVLQGATSALCNEEGWDTDPPTCQAIVCRDPGVPEDGQRIGDEFTYGSVVQFSCSGGYTITGSNTIICEASGTWSDRTPRCHAVPCPPLPALANGTRVGDVFEYGVTVNFQCFPGYQLVGNRSTTCLSTRVWSNSVPNCIPCAIGYYKSGVDGDACVSCPEFSTTLVQASSSLDHCICDIGTARSEDGLSCEVMLCPDLDAPENGVILDCSNEFGGECSFDCNPGYVLRGRSTSRCGNYGWSDSVPFCQACPPNTYKEDAGSLTCRPCPRFSHTNGLPGTSLESCVCRDGYSGEDGGPCVDVDECQENNGGCSHVCDNTQGGYICSCDIPGYEISEDGHTCYAAEYCPELEESPSYGDLDCRYTEGENGYICFIVCSAGYFFVSGQNNYLTCGGETNFRWSHRLVNATAAMPGCMEEFFTDTQLPISFAYEAPLSCGGLIEVEGEIMDLIQDRVYHLEACAGRCGGINFVTNCTETEDQGSRLKVSFEILLRNLQNESVPEDCGSGCRQSNMRQMLADTFTMKTELQGFVESSNSLDFDYSDDTSVVVVPDSFLMGSLSIMCQEPGRVMTRNRQCVPCEAGYYLPRRDDEYCSPCPVGTYQRLTGQTECIPCPEDSTTLTEGSSHPTMCSQRVTVVQGYGGNIYGFNETRPSGTLSDQDDIDIDEVLAFLK